MRTRRALIVLLASIMAVGCGMFAPQPKPIKIKTMKRYPREQRFWAGEIGDVQGWVMPLVLVSPTKNKALREATKEDYTFFMVVIHHKTSDEALSPETLKPAIKLSIQEKPFTNVQASEIDPLILARLNELSAERSRLARQVATPVEKPAEEKPTEKKEGEAAPEALTLDAKAQLAKVENEINQLNEVRPYLRPGHVTTKRGVVWFLIMAVPCKEDIASIQYVQWTHGDPGLVDLGEYGYRFEQLDKLKLKQVGEHWVPGWLPERMKGWMEHFWF